MFVVLCGGLGTRMPAQGLPKPLTLINARPMLAHALAAMPAHVAEVLFVYGAHLRGYNFEEVVINLFRAVRCRFVCLDYATRGAAESALAGVMQASPPLPVGEPLVFFDNDNVYPAGAFPPGGGAPPPGAEVAAAWVGCAPEPTGSSAMSFVTLDAERSVTAIAEKRRVSDTYCTGVYGFASAAGFIAAARAVLRDGNSRVNGEAYMSCVVAHLVASGARVTGVHLPTLPLGSAALAGEAALATFGDKPLRLCFDLDNTLVTYPTVPGDYGSVRPIEPMLAFLRAAKAAGHTIIIYTARRMGSHGHNPGRVVADIARVTLDTLDAFRVPYDELIFGKPLADVYFDDRACNPYTQSLASVGFVGEEAAAAAAAAVGAALGAGIANRHNVTQREGEAVVKRGPAGALGDEAAYYAAVAPLPLARLFARCLGVEEAPGSAGQSAVLRTRFERGATFSSLFMNRLLEPYHLDALFAALDELHGCATPPGAPAPPTEAEVCAQYDAKLVARFAVGEHYPFEDAAEVQSALLARLRAFLAARRFRIVPHIHGDAWFANVLLTPSNEVRMIDMRGSVAGRRTTGGDALYDYAKVAQSLLGFDEAVRGGPAVPEAFRTDLLAHFWAAVAARGAEPDDVRTCTAALISGTFWALSAACRPRVWALLRGNM